MDKDKFEQDKDLIDDSLEFCADIQRYYPHRMYASANPVRFLSAVLFYILQNASIYTDLYGKALYHPIQTFYLQEDFSYMSLLFSSLLQLCHRQSCKATYLYFPYF